MGLNKLEMLGSGGGVLYIGGRIADPLARGTRGAHAPPPPQEPKRSAFWDRKRFKIIQNNAVMVGLTISMHFQQFQNLSWGTMSRTP